MNARVAAFPYLLGAAALAADPIASGQQRAGVFRAGVESVSVNVSVKHGNVPIPGLTAEDFVLTDNGMAQVVQAVAIEAVPVDVTVFHDTSPSQGGRLEALKDDVRRIAAMLRPGDRFRLITFDRQVHVAVPWQPADAELDLDDVAIGPISPVYDGLLTALMHRPDVGRRHLVVALTDAVDAGSAVSSWGVHDVAARAEGVLHVVLMSYASHRPANASDYWYSVHEDHGGVDRIEDAAELTGGDVHDRLFGSPDPVEAFRQVFDDFRRSYVLHYVPAGVKDEGWHEIEVSVPSAPRATIRARRGYYGG